MPTDAAQLIADLDAHPKACGMLGLRFGLGCAGTPMVSNSCISLLENDTEPWNSEFSRWLTGACVEKHHELDIDLPVKCRSNGETYYAINDGNETRHHTFLGALLSVLENS